MPVLVSDGVGRARYDGPQFEMLWLPILLGGMRVLRATGEPGAFFVDNSTLRSKDKGVAYSKSPLFGTTYADFVIARWGNTVRGTVSEGWLNSKVDLQALWREWQEELLIDRRLSQATTLWLPERVDGLCVLVATHEGHFRVDNTLAHSMGPGLSYHKTPNVDDKIVGRMADWDSLVKGVLKDGWLRVELHDDAPASGALIGFNSRKLPPCEACQGTGKWFFGLIWCMTCGGHGRVERENSHECAVLVGCLCSEDRSAQSLLEVTSTPRGLGVELLAEHVDAELPPMAIPHRDSEKFMPMARGSAAEDGTWASAEAASRPPLHPSLRSLCKPSPQPSVHPILPLSPAKPPLRSPASNRTPATPAIDEFFNR